MAAYSRDLRQRILDAVERDEGSLRQIARRFVVSLSFIVRSLQLHRRTGSIDPKPPGGGHPAALGPDDLERLKELIRQQPDATLKELRQRLGASCSLTTIWRATEELRLPRKKMLPRAAERDSPDVQEKRRDFCAELAGIDPRRLVFIDETSADTSMHRTYGRGPVGERVYTGAPGHWDTITLTCGLRLSGVTAAMAFEGATNTGTFESYVEQVLVPELRRGDLGQSQAAPVGGGDRGRQEGRGSCAAVAALEPGPDTDRGDVLEGQGGVEVGRSADQGRHL
jgi:transposase